MFGYLRSFILPVVSPLRRVMCSGCPYHSGGGSFAARRGHSRNTLGVFHNTIAADLGIQKVVKTDQGGTRSCNDHRSARCLGTKGFRSALTCCPGHSGTPLRTAGCALGLGTPGQIQRKKSSKRLNRSGASSLGHQHQPCYGELDIGPMKYQVSCPPREFAHDRERWGSMLGMGARTTQ